MSQPANPQGDRAYLQWLNSLSESVRAAALLWVESRPPEIQSLIRRYPPGTSREIHGRQAWVVSYTESDGGGMLSMSYHFPYTTHDRAMADRFWVCPNCLEGQCAGGHPQPDRPPPAAD